MHLYTCGAPRYMDGVFEAAAAKGWPEEALHREYFSVPEADGLGEPCPSCCAWRAAAARSTVPADRSATDVLAEAGIAVDTKCSDGLCGVCATPTTPRRPARSSTATSCSAAREREQRVILCCSRAKRRGRRDRGRPLSVATGTLRLTARFRA